MKRAIIFFLLFAFLQVLGAALALLVCKVAAAGSGEAELSATFRAVSAGRAQLCFNLVFCAAALWFFHREKTLRLSLESPRKPTLGKFVPAAAVLAFVVFAVGIDFIASPFLDDDDGQMELFKNMKDDPLCLLLLCFVGPLTEELVFRKGILDGFLRHNLKVWLAIGLSALLFAIVHGNWAQGIVALPLGAALGGMFVRTRNLKICLPAHMANNILAVVLIRCPEIVEKTDTWSTATNLCVGIPVACAGLVGILLTLKPSRPAET